MKGNSVGFVCSSTGTMKRLWPKRIRQRFTVRVGERTMNAVATAPVTEWAAEYTGDNFLVYVPQALQAELSRRGEGTLIGRSDMRSCLIEAGKMLMTRPELEQTGFDHEFYVDGKNRANFRGIVARRTDGDGFVLISLERE